MFRTSRVYDSTQSETLPRKLAGSVGERAGAVGTALISKPELLSLSALRLSTPSRCGTSAASIVGSYYNCILEVPSCSTYFSYASSIRLNV
jgi:hypothetical protein